jgi:hypothetical protein
VYEAERRTRTRERERQAASTYLDLIDRPLVKELDLGGERHDLEFCLFCYSVVGVEFFGGGAARGGERGRDGEEAVEEVCVCKWYDGLEDGEVERVVETMCSRWDD